MSILVWKPTTCAYDCVTHKKLDSPAVCGVGAYNGFPDRSCFFVTQLWTLWRLSRATSKASIPHSGCVWYPVSQVGLGLKSHSTKLPDKIAE